MSVLRLLLLYEQRCIEVLHEALLKAGFLIATETSILEVEVALAHAVFNG